MRMLVIISMLVVGISSTLIADNYKHESVMTQQEINDYFGDSGEGLENDLPRDSKAWKEQNEANVKYCKENILSEEMATICADIMNSETITQEHTK